MLGFAALTLTLGMPMTPLAGGGSMYVFAELGPSGNPVCHDARSTDFMLAALLEGLGDEILCIDGATDATSFADTKIELREDGLTAAVNGWGEAIGSETYAAFSRHDIQASMDVAVVAPLRTRIDWFYFAVGLGAVHIDIHRLGDLGGPDEPSPPIVDRGTSSYIDLIMEDGVDVLRMPAGRWRISMWTTHQALDTKPGFTHSFARTTHTATFVPLGDADGSGTVDVTDLLLLLEQYGNCDGCMGDLDGSGTVDVNDILQVLSDWSA